MIISGGQTGADLAGLEVAYQNGIPTGGFAPKGWKTNKGPNILLRDKYHLKEHPMGYKERTWANVEASHATVRLCVDFWSAGEICTMNAIKYYNRPYFDVYLPSPAATFEFITWLNINNITTLNVAGNSQNTRGYDIYTMAFNYLNNVIKTIRSN